MKGDKIFVVRKNKLYRVTDKEEIDDMMKHITCNWANGNSNYFYNDVVRECNNVDDLSKFLQCIFSKNKSIKKSDDIDNYEKIVNDIKKKIRSFDYDFYTTRELVIGIIKIVYKKYKTRRIYKILEELGCDDEL